MAVQIGTPPLQGCFFLGWSSHLKELMCLINILQMQSETEMRKDLNHSKVMKTRTPIITICNYYMARLQSRNQELFNNASQDPRPHTYASRA